jgi:pimeloyl-ACP methyl ester carboxylesterase
MSRQAGAPAQTYRNRMTFSMLESIKVPALLITSDADMYAPPPLLKMFTARMKGAQSLVIPEAGHSSYWEKPDAFNRAVLDFLKKH